MMATIDSTARSVWTGGLADGSGAVTLESGVGGTMGVSWPRRAAGEGSGQTTPEELIAAAHAACYGMALSHEIAQAGGTPRSLDTSATATFSVGDDGVSIAGIRLVVRGAVDGMDTAGFAAAAEAAKAGCPVSRALSVPITLDAALA